MVYASRDVKNVKGFVGRRPIESAKEQTIRVTSVDTGALVVQTHRTFRQN